MIKDFIKYAFFIALMGFLSCNKQEIESVDEGKDISITKAASEVTSISATLSGKANLGKAVASDLTLGIAFSTSPGMLPSNSSMIEATKIEADYSYVVNVTKLDPGTTYFYRSYVSEGGEISYGKVKSFTTKLKNSFMSAIPAENVSTIGATLLAKINLSDIDHNKLGRNGFIYGIEGDMSTAGGVIADLIPYNDGTALKANVGALLPSSIYWFSPYVTIDGKEYQGDTLTFSTLAAENMIETKDATDVGSTSVTLNAKLDLTNCKYKSVSYGFYCEAGNNGIYYGGKLSNNEYSVKLTNLASGKRYSFVAFVKFTDDNWRQFEYLGEEKIFETHYVSVDSISINKADISVAVGSKTQIVATVWPLSATNRNVIWKSLDETVATVAGEGLSAYIQGINPGQTIITATTEDGGISAFCVVNVVDLVETLNVKSITAVSAVLEGRARKDLYFGSAVFGMEYSQNSDFSSPTRIPSKDFTNEHIYSVGIGCLDPDTEYYYRSYVYYSGNYTYGQVSSFKTQKIGSLISASEPSEIAPDKVLLSAGLNLDDCVYSSGKYGFVYKRPKLSGSVFTACTMVLPSEGKTFTYSLQGLIHSTYYSAAAYITLDGKTYYTEWYDFTTPDYTVSLTTGDATDITISTASLYATLAINTNETLSKETGFIYSRFTNSLKELKESGTTVTSSLVKGVSSASLSNLNCGSTYYYVSFAKVDGKDYYGDIRSFVVRPPEYVDLGLTVKWRSWNIGANYPHEKGNGYAWGEVNTKSSYSWENYRWLDNVKYYSGSSGVESIQFTKYTRSDGITQLALDDDVAYKSLGPGCRIPTKEETEELIANCLWERTTVSGVNGLLLTSRKNGSTLFFPSEDGASVSYWTCSLRPFDDYARQRAYAYVLSSSSTSPFTPQVTYRGRYLQTLIRPVRE